MTSHNAFLINWVKGAYGMELGLAPVLEQQTASLMDDPELRKGLDQHLRKTRKHAQLLHDYLERAGEDPSSIRPSAPISKALAHPSGGEPSIAVQTELIDYVTEAYEWAFYKALNELAVRLGDRDAAKVSKEILKDEIAIVGSLDKRLNGGNGGGGQASRPGNAAIAREIVAALNAHDIDRYDRYFASDYQLETPGMAEPQNRRQNREMMEAGEIAFPDAHWDIQRIFENGDDVVIEWIWTGTQTGPLGDPSGAVTPPTGRPSRMHGSTSYHFRNGKVVHERDYFDASEMMPREGAAPAAGEASAAPIKLTGRGLVHLEIPAADRHAAARFYGELFGWESEHLDESMRYSTFTSGNVAGGFPDLDTGYNPGDVTFYVGSSDIEADLNKAQKLGGKTLVPRTEIPNMGWFALLSDPTGNRVGLFSMEPARSQERS